MVGYIPTAFTHPPAVALYQFFRNIGIHHTTNKHSWRSPVASFLQVIWYKFGYINTFHISGKTIASVSSPQKSWQRICNEFLEATSYSLGDLEKGWVSKYDFSKRPPTYLHYEESLARIPLETTDFPSSPDLWQLLRERRSKRNFTETPLSWTCCCGEQQASPPTWWDYQLRTAPSSGALYTKPTFWLTTWSPWIKGCITWMWKTGAWRCWNERMYLR